jgi:hypothetical protein
MGAHRKTVDHGAAIRVPPAHDAKGWQILMTWLGEAGRVKEQGLVEVRTPIGPGIAAPGDWIVLSATGSFHVTRPGR